MSKQLQAARAKVNALEFGTKEWEDAMQVVRKLIAQQSADTDFGKHTSVDGDIWSV